MEMIGWIVAIILFIVAFAGLVYPIIPSAFFLVGGFLLYGWIYTFDGMNIFFWIIQVLFVILLFGADTLSNLVGVKKFGGSKAGMWGSTIGLLFGPHNIKKNMRCRCTLRRNRSTNRRKNSCNSCTDVIAE